METGLWRWIHRESFSSICKRPQIQEICIKYRACKVYFRGIRCTFNELHDNLRIVSIIQGTDDSLSFAFTDLMNTVLQFTCIRILQILNYIEFHFVSIVGSPFVKGFPILVRRRKQRYFLHTRRPCFRKDYLQLNDISF